MSSTPPTDPSDPSEDDPPDTANDLEPDPEDEPDDLDGVAGVCVDCGVELDVDAMESDRDQCFDCYTHSQG